MGEKPPILFLLTPVLRALLTYHPIPFRYAFLVRSSVDLAAQFPGGVYLSQLNN
jgi:hypothetical protein